MRSRPPKPADVLARALETGYLVGNALRTGPGSLHAQWLAHCRSEGEFAFIAVSLGHVQARVEFVLTTPLTNADFTDPDFSLRRHLQHAIHVLQGQQRSGQTLQVWEGGDYLDITGVTRRNAIWLAEQFAAIALRFQRYLDPLPANVIDITTARRQRAWKGAIA